MEATDIKEAEKHLNDFLDFLEIRYYVTLEIKRGAYGAANLILKDTETGEEYEFNRE